MLATLVTSAMLSATCANWGSALTVGSLSHDVLPEASGIAVSRAFPGRLYHVNDSGNAAAFVLTDAAGRQAQSVRIGGFDAEDVEDLAVGSCGQADAATCLFVADIGDNDSERSRIKVALIREKADFARSERPLRTLTLRYPDGAKNAEGFAVHPNGDLYLATKGARGEIYRIPAATWWNADDDDVLTLQLAGRVSLGDDAEVTSLDIRPDGEALVLLTYEDAYELPLDLTTKQRIPLTRLRKQEAMAYELDGSGLVYSTESKNSDGPLMRVGCRGE